VYDCGISLNPAIDIGQIEGGFVMGIGLYLQEDVLYSQHDGELLTQGTWEYKVPCSKDIPEHFKVTLLENAHNASGVLNSKATGEPPYALATSVYFAVKKALLDSRSERGNDGFFHLDVPATVARRQEAASIQAKDYTM
jgi:xanthine dehydrogenase/oxidase